MGLFVRLEVSRKEAVTQATQEGNANYKEDKVPSRLADPVNKRKMKIHISQSQISSKPGKQSTQADNSKRHHQHAEKRIEPTKVNCC